MSNTTKVINGFHLSDALSNEEQKIIETALKMDLQYIDNLCFDQPGAEQYLFSETPEFALDDVSTTWNGILNNENDRVEVKEKEFTLPYKQQRILFLQYNFIRKEMANILDIVENQRLNKKECQRLIVLHEKAKKIYDTLCVANMGLIHAMFKRCHIRDDSTPRNDYYAEGHVALMKSVTRFDVSRGFAFSTYACTSIYKAFTRFAEKRIALNRREVKIIDAYEDNNGSPYLRTVSTKDIDGINDLRESLDYNLAGLSFLEETIIRSRFFGNSTLQDLGDRFNLSKERIRQLEHKALLKLKEQILPERINEESEEADLLVTA